MKRRFIIFRSFRVKLTLAFILAMIFAGATSDFLVYRYAFNSQFEQLRDKLKTIAQVAALNIDAQTLQAIPLSKEGLSSQAYSVITRKLADIKNAVPSITYLYVLKKTERPGIVQFIVDLDTDGDKKGSASAVPGDTYDPYDFPEMLKAFDAPTADKRFGSDRWGAFLSGYAPILDIDGKAVAIIGVDMTAQDVCEMQKKIGALAAAVFALGLVLSVALAIFISGRVAGKIRALTEGTRRVAQGDLDHKVAVHGDDEIARLAYFFNKMSSDLKEHINQLRKATADKERILRELEIARGIQQGFLPDSAPVIEGMEIAALSMPARVVGGDFYDFINVAPDKWALVVADVSGKGIPAAIFMALSRALVRAGATGTVSPAEAVGHANELIHKDSKTDMFVTLFYAVLDAKTKELNYANAGHNPPMHISGHTSSVVLLKAQGVPLGIVSDISIANESVFLRPGDIVVLYTDGVTEANNINREQFEMERLARVVMENKDLTAEGIVSRVKEELEEFVGSHPQFDDITLMILKAKQGG
jgi:serine phosphatase RsbU (regulator of sigma subunit)